MVMEKESLSTHGGAGLNFPADRVVFHILSRLIPGGAERLVVNLLRYHDREHYTPVCVCLGESTGSHYEAEVQSCGVPLHFLGKGQKADWKTLQKLNTLFRRYRPLVVHTHMLGLNYAYPLMIWHRTPVRIHTVHSLAQKELGIRVSRIVRTLAFRHRIGGVVPVAVAQEVRVTLEQLYGYWDAPVIANGIPTDDYAFNLERRVQWRAKHRIEPEACVVTIVARLVELKNHALLLRAFARLRTGQSVYLLIVGDGPLRESLEQQATQLGISSKVRFLGLRSDVPDILNASDIFTLASRWEGNPMSVQEAMASGLPVVATAVGGIPELIEPGTHGMLVENEDEIGFANALQTLVDSPELRQRMGQAARAYAVKHFDIRNTVRAYEQLYESILAKRYPSRSRK